MTDDRDNPEQSNPTEPLRPLPYERRLAWPWSVGQTDPVKLQNLARRAALFRRLGCLIAVGIAGLMFGLLLLFARQSGMLR
jgi:hypothetical protein